MKAAQTTSAALTMKAELKAASLVQQMDDMTEKMMGCSSAVSLAKKLAEMMVRMSDWWMAVNLVEKWAEMMVKVMDC